MATAAKTSLAFAATSAIVLCRHSAQNFVGRCTVTKASRQTIVRWRCAAPRFRSTEDADSDGPKTSFSSTPPPSTTPLTPNQRVLVQVRQSMERLGVLDNDEPVPAPVVRKPVDISRVNPASALLGSVGAFAIFYTAWSTLQFFVQFYLTHPFETDMYVLRRINAIVRTVLVGIFALASGISFVTSLGLLLLSGRTAIAAVTGEFRIQRPADVDGEIAVIKPAPERRDNGMQAEDVSEDK
jgi:Protein of unknown function (DUF3082)